MAPRTRVKAASLPAPSTPPLASSSSNKPSRRWRKALSVGSTASSASTITERDTDGAEFDMAVPGHLTLDAHSGVYSGWIYVSSAGKRFVRRFCRLEELVCKLYTSAATPPPRPVARHVVISVTRVHSRNKAFAFTDHEDRTVLLHTALGADFERWYGTFAAMVRHTQVAKPRAGSVGFRRGSHALTRVAGSQERARALTDGCVASRAPRTRPEAAAERVDGFEDPERTHTAWFYLPAPWWRQALTGRAHIRRYVVFSGVTASCFSVNKGGKRAEFTRTVASCSYDPQQDAGELELGFSGPHRKLLLHVYRGQGDAATSSNVHTAREAAAYLDAALSRGSRRV